MYSNYFSQMNPQHTVPVLEDDGEYIGNSHAICTYLISKYADEDHYLYPKDLMKRAQINRMLHFDSYVLYKALRDADIPVWFGAPAAPDELLAVLHNGLTLLEAYLNGREYLVGDGMTLADLNCSTTSTAFKMHFPIEPERYPNVTAWMERMSAWPHHEEFIEKPVGALRKTFMERRTLNFVLIQWTPKHLAYIAEGFQRMAMEIAAEAANGAAEADGEAASDAVDVNNIYGR